MMRYVRCLSLVLGFGIAAPAAAQVAYVRGVVVDTLGKPIPDANVIARLAPRARGDTGRVVLSITSGRDGRFSFGRLDSKARYIFSARKLGYGVISSQPTAPVAGDTTEIRFEMLQTSLDAVRIVASAPREYRIDAAEIAKRPVNDALDVVMNYRPRMLGDVYKNCAPDTSKLLNDVGRFIRRTPRSYGNPDVYPFQIYVNGTRWTIRGAKNVLADIPAKDIQELRYIDCWDKATPQYRNSLMVILKPGVRY